MYSPSYHNNSVYLSDNEIRHISIVDLVAQVKRATPLENQINTCNYIDQDKQDYQDTQIQQSVSQIDDKKQDEEDEEDNDDIFDYDHFYKQKTKKSLCKKLNIFNKSK